MGNFFKFMALILGAFTVTTGITSCKDDPKCCEWTDDYGDDYRYCDDDLPQGYTFAQVEVAAAYYDGSCD